MAKLLTIATSTIAETSKKSKQIYIFIHTHRHTHTHTLMIKEQRRQFTAMIDSASATDHTPPTSVMGRKPTRNQGPCGQKLSRQ